jgi:hypothetical protein
MERKKCRLIVTDYGPIVVLADHVRPEDARQVLETASDWIKKNSGWQDQGATSQVLAMFDSDWEVEDWRGRL